MLDLGTFGGDSSAGSAVNDNGQVAGYVYRSDGAFHAFTSQGQRLTDLGTLGGDFSAAYAINSVGQIAGEAYTAQNMGTHAFLYSGGRMIDLGSLGSYARALAINGNGVVVGQSDVPSKSYSMVYHAFIYSGGKMRDLNSMIGSGSGWVLNAATGINDAGQIVGYGTKNGHQRAFLLQ